MVHSHSKAYVTGRPWARGRIALNTAVVAVGAAFILAGLSAVVAGYGYYVAMKEADEAVQDRLEEQGLAGIPGLDIGDRAEIGLAASVAGAVVALVGGVVLAYGALTRSKDTTPQLNLASGATNFCGCCGEPISPNACSCPSCGRQIRPPEYSS